MVVTNLASVSLAWADRVTGITLFLAHLVGVPLRAQQGPAGAVSTTADERAPWPRSEETLPTEVRRRLAAACSPVVTRTLATPRCSGLFAALAADGVAAMVHTRCAPAPACLEGVRGRGLGVAAFTTGGGAFLCTAFPRLDAEGAAHILARLLEMPRLTGALTSGETSRLVGARGGDAASGSVDAALVALVPCAAATAPRQP